MTLDELRSSMLVVGPDGIAVPDRWDAAWRAQLVEGLAVLVTHLWAAGIDRIFVDGSFVEDKPRPGDIDGYFECDMHEFITGRLAVKLNALAGEQIWDWETRRPDPNSAKNQLPMWHRYHVELYPHFGQPSGIRDEYGHEQPFPAAFRKRRLTYQQKGIVQIVRAHEGAEQSRGV